MYENMPDERKNSVKLTNVVWINPESESKTSQESKLDICSCSSSSDGSPTISGTKCGPLHFVADSKETKSDRYSIAVIGSGDFGRSIAMKIARSGYGVNIGSRNPEKCRNLLTDAGVSTMSAEEAIANATSNIIILAIPKAFYDTAVASMYDQLNGKIVIDVSNRNTVHRKMVISQAEYLQRLLPRSAVVKAFNVLSAYILDSGGIQGSKEVFYAGDIYAAKTKVNDLIRAMGYIPVDQGPLRAAREIEDIPARQFPEWRTPLIISSVSFLILFLLSLSKYQVCWTLDWDRIKEFGDNWNWKRWNTIPTTTVNSTLAVHAITMLSLCYIPGLLAAYLQLIRGTKYSRFPNWLDKWLRMRKQIGLLMLFSASLHAILSCAVFSPTYHDLAWGSPKEIFTDAFEGSGWTGKVLVKNQTVKIFGSEKMQWRGEAFLVSGVFAYGIAVLLGITSLPSVTQALSWKEFAFVQSKLGWTCLIFAVAHDSFYGWPYMFSPSCYVPPTFNYALWLPLIAILMKLPLIMPCVSNVLQKIREGWERTARQTVNTKEGSNNFSIS